MNNKVLSKKVMISLLTISCVYLGGTSVLPIAEAAIVDGQDVADGTTLNFTDNHTINQNMDKQPAITIDQNKNVTINAQGTLNILGSGKPSSQGNAIAYAYVGATLDFTGNDIIFSGSVADGDKAVSYTHLTLPTKLEV